MGSGEAVGKSDHNGLRSNYELRKQILVDSFEGILLRRRDIRSLLKEKSRVKENALVLCVLSYSNNYCLFFVGTIS